MSGRIRTLKPEWLEDELLAGSSDAARLLSAGLILMADDHGRGRASSPEIAFSVWRYEMAREDGANAPEVLARASRAIRELAAIRFVTLYKVAGQSYFEIRNWTRHQRVDKPGLPRVPAPQTPTDPPPSGDSGPIPECVANKSRVAPEPFAPDPRSGSPISDPDPDRDLRARERAPTEARAAPDFRDAVASSWRRGYVRRFERASGLTHRGPDGAHLAALIEAAMAQDNPLAFVEASLGGFFADEWAIKARFPIKNLAAHAERYASNPKVRRGADATKYRPSAEWTPPAIDNVVPIGDAAGTLLASLGLKAPGGGT